MAVTITPAALQYRGSGYVYGGPGWPPGNWDCSSYFSEVTARQLGLLMPGGGRWGSPGYPPNSHGPDVDAYAAYYTEDIAPGTPGAAVMWVGAGPNGHIGFCLGPNRMISALNPNYGTAVTPIDGYGPGGLSPVYRRITGAAGGSGVAGAGAPGVDVTSLWQQVLPGVSWQELALPALVVAAVLAAGVVATGLVLAGGAAGTVWLARRGLS